MSCFLFLCKYCFCKRCFIRSFSDLFRGFSGIFQISFLGFSGHVVLFRELLHLYLALLRCRDDFFRPDSSPACSFARQGLFFPSGVIPSLLFCSAGIIFSARIHPQLALFSTRMISIGQIHPQLALFFRRDDFDQANASLQAESFRYGCISTANASPQPNASLQTIPPETCLSGNVPLRAHQKNPGSKMLPG